MDALATQLLSYGAPGATVLVLLYVVRTLYQRNETLNDTLRDLVGKYSGDQATTANALNRLSDLLVSRKEGT